VQIEIRSLRSLAVRRQRACVVGSVGQAKKKNWLKSITYQFRNSRTLPISCSHGGHGVHGGVLAARSLPPLVSGETSGRHCIELAITLSALFFQRATLFNELLG
jgi:hypothetical protein